MGKAIPPHRPFTFCLADHPFRVSTARYTHRKRPDEMAEVAGLALGVIAMTSLFKDCVDLFLHFDSARNSDREYQFLDTKLDIERTLLLKWEERVRLTKHVRPFGQRFKILDLRGMDRRRLGSQRYQKCVGLSGTRTSSSA